MEEEQVMRIEAKLNAIESGTVTVLNELVGEINSLREEINQNREETKQELENVLGEFERTKRDVKEKLDAKLSQIKDKLDMISPSTSTHKRNAPEALATSTPTTTPTSSSSKKLKMSPLQFTPSPITSFKLPETLDDVPEIKDELEPYFRPVSAREKLNSVQSAFFHYQMHKFENDNLQIDILANRIISNGISANIWPRNYKPDSKCPTFIHFLKEKIKGIRKTKKQEEMNEEAEANFLMKVKRF